MNAPATLQRITAKIFGDLDLGQTYIDDVVMASELLSEHMGHVTNGCERVRWAGLFAK